MLLVTRCRDQAQEPVRFAANRECGPGSDSGVYFTTACDSLRWVERSALGCPAKSDGIAIKMPRKSEFVATSTLEGVSAGDCDRDQQGFDRWRRRHGRKRPRRGHPWRRKRCGDRRDARSDAEPSARGSQPRARASDRSSGVGARQKNGGSIRGRRFQLNEEVT